MIERSSRNRWQRTNDRKLSVLKKVLLNASAGSSVQPASRWSCDSRNRSLQPSISRNPEVFLSALLLHRHRRATNNNHHRCFPLAVSTETISLFHCPFYFCLQMDQSALINMFVAAAQNKNKVLNLEENRFLICQLSQISK